MWSIVPFKVLTQGKQRLASMLSTRERGGLSRAMIEDLLTALRQVQQLNGILIVSDDSEAMQLAGQYGVAAIREDHSRGAGLNNAVNCALDRLNSASVDDVMIIHGDLPLVSPADLSGLITQHLQLGRPALTLVPDRWRRGTNCLLSSGGSTVPPCFGKDSLARHQQSAEQQGIPFQIMEVASVMFDIDTPADLRELNRALGGMDGSVAVNTRSILETIDEARFLEPSSETVGRNYAKPKHEVLQKWKSIP